MIKINMGFDHGYGYLNFRSSILKDKLSSYIVEIDEEQASQLRENISEINKDNLVVKYKDKYYVIGGKVERSFSGVKRRIEKDRIGSDFSMAQLLSCVGLVCKNDNMVQVNLCTGVPNKLRSVKNKFAESLKGSYKISFLLNNREITKTIDIIESFSILQPVGVLYSDQFTQEDRENLNILLVDIGHGTTDLIVSIQDEVRQDNITYVEGINYCFKRLKDDLIKDFMNKYHIYDLSEKEVQFAIEKNMLKTKKDGIIDISDYTRKVYKKYIEMLFTEINNNYLEVMNDLDMVMISGGVANNDVFLSELENKFNEFDLLISVADNPQEAVCEGYYNIINDSFVDDFSEEVAMTIDGDDIDG